MDQKKILIVDDEPDLVEMLTLRLEANSYQFGALSRDKFVCMVLP